MINRKKKKGQSTLEYIILVVAVVAVLVGFLATSNGGFQTAVNSTLSSGTSGMKNMGSRISANFSPANP